MTNKRKWELGAGMIVALVLFAAALGVYQEQLLRYRLLEALDHDKPEVVAALVGRVVQLYGIEADGHGGQCTVHEVIREYALVFKEIHV